MLLLGSLCVLAQLLSVLCSSLARPPWGPRTPDPPQMVSLSYARLRRRAAARRLQSASSAKTDCDARAVLEVRRSQSASASMNVPNTLDSAQQGEMWVSSRPTRETTYAGPPPAASAARAWDWRAVRCAVGGCLWPLRGVLVVAAVVVSLEGAVRIWPLGRARRSRRKVRRRDASPGPPAPAHAAAAARHSGQVELLMVAGDLKSSRARRRQSRERERVWLNQIFLESEMLLATGRVRRSCGSCCSTTATWLPRTRALTTTTTPPPITHLSASVLAYCSFHRCARG